MKITFGANFQEIIFETKFEPVEESDFAIDPRKI